MKFQIEFHKIGSATSPILLFIQTFLLFVSSNPPQYDPESPSHSDIMIDNPMAKDFLNDLQLGSPRSLSKEGSKRVELIQSPKINTFKQPNRKLLTNKQILNHKQTKNKIMQIQTGNLLKLQKVQQQRLPIDYNPEKKRKLMTTIEGVVKEVSSEEREIKRAKNKKTGKEFRQRQALKFNLPGNEHLKEEHKALRRQRDRERRIKRQEAASKGILTRAVLSNDRRNERKRRKYKEDKERALLIANQKEI